MAERELAIVVRAKDLASKTLKGVRKEVRGIAKEGGKGLQTTAANLTKLGVAAAGIGVAGLAGGIKLAADFESQLNTINTVAQQTPEQLNAIGTTIRKMARTSGQDLSDLTAAYYDLVSAGIKPGADATEVLAQAQTLAIGGLATTSETVDLLTSALNVYHMGAKDAAHVTDVFAGAIAAGKTTAADLASVFATVGPMAQASGIEIEELGAAFGTMTAAGVKPAQVATNIRGALVKLQKPTAVMLKLQKELGVDFAKMARDKGLAFTYGEIRKAAEKAHIPLAVVLGDVEAQQYALGVTGDAAKTYEKNLTDAQNKTGVAAEQAAERQKGLNFQLSRLRAVAIDAGITIGSKLLPKLTPLAERALAFLESHEADIERFGDEIAGGFDKAVQFAEKIPWAAVGSGLKTAADWAGKLMDVFLKMPPQAQATIIALAGLNKLSGGAVSGIVGELGKGLIKGVLGMTAGVVNIKAGVVNGGGVSGGGGGKGGFNPAMLIPLVGVAAVQVAVAEAVGGPLRELLGVTDTGLGTVKAEVAGLKIVVGQSQAAAAHQITAEQRAATAAQVTAANRGTTAVEKMRSRIASEISGAAAKHGRSVDRTNNAIEILRRGTGAAISASAAKNAAASRAAGVTAAKGGHAAAAAIRHKKWRFVNNFTANIRTTISVRDQIQQRHSVGRYGHVSEYG